MGVLPATKVVPLKRRGRHAQHVPWRGAVAELDARVAEIERRFAALDRRYAALDTSSRMQVAVLVSLLVHAILMFGLTFKMPDPSKLSNLAQPLEVVLVNTKTKALPSRPMRSPSTISTAAAIPTPIAAPKARCPWCATNRGQPSLR